MQIYPAIDLQHGECVRLTQGDFSKAKIYQSDPFIQASQFIDQGATWLHVVDLDGAKDPNHHQFSLIQQLVEKTPLTIQTGGGIRTAGDVRCRLEAGVSRVVIGSIAVYQPELVRDIIREHNPESIVIALDVFIEDDQPMVATHGWQKTSEKSLHDVIEDYEDVGLKHILCTDINSDGALLGPNFSLYQAILQEYPQLCLQASGGVNSLDDIIKLKALGVNGVIVGKALYENHFTLKEALAC